MSKTIKELLDELEYNLNNASAKVEELYKMTGEPEPIPEPTPDPEPIPEPTSDLFFGFWYSEEVPDDNPLKALCTAGQSRSANVKLMKPVVDSGLKVIPSIGGFEPDESEYDHRKRIGWYVNGFNTVGHENIKFVILRDEPTKLSEQQMYNIVDEAGKQYGDLPYTFTFTRGMLLRNQFPKNLKHVGNNLYPFFDKDAPEGYIQINNYEEFRDHADAVYKNVRETIDNPQIVITAQTFYTKEGAGGNPWRKPPLESPEWYMRYARERSDVVGILFWE